VETLYRATQPFLTWVEERDPEAAETMNGELTPESIALWEHYVDEYVASMTAD
jgi:hypothetical protein